MPSTAGTRQTCLPRRSEAGGKAAEKGEECECLQARGWAQWRLDRCRLSAHLSSQQAALRSSNCSWFGNFVAAADAVGIPVRSAHRNKRVRACKVASAGRAPCRQVGSAQQGAMPCVRQQPPASRTAPKPVQVCVTVSALLPLPSLGTPAILSGGGSMPFRSFICSFMA